MRLPEVRADLPIFGPNGANSRLSQASVLPDYVTSGRSGVGSYKESIGKCPGAKLSATKALRVNSPTGLANRNRQAQYGKQVSTGR